MSHDAPAASSVDGSPYRFGIVASRYNGELVEALLDRVRETLQEAGTRESAVSVVRVPGSHEIPWAVARLARKGSCDCLVALGVLIGGDTNHHEMVGQSVSQALQQVAITSGVPVINGVIVTTTLAQARARCTGRINRGPEFAHAGLEMAALRRQLGDKS